MIFNTNITDYLGKKVDYILTLVSVGIEHNYYECMFMYNESDYIFTSSDDFIEALGCDIEEHEDYLELMKFIYKKVVPYNDMINTLDEFDLDKYYLDTIKATESRTGINVHNDDITSKEET